MKLMRNQSSALIKLIWKKVGLTPVIGVFLIVAGYYISVDLEKKGNELQNTGVVTQAVILRRNYAFRLNDKDEYRITYTYKAISPLDGEWRDYIEAKEVTRRIYETPGCRDIDGSQQELLLTEGSLSNCVEATITVGSENLSAQICEGNPTHLVRNVTGCEAIQIIYNSEDPNQSWILGTQPSSTRAVEILIITSGFGIILLGYSIYSIMKSRGDINSS